VQDGLILVVGFKQVSACVVLADDSDIMCSMECIYESCDSSVPCVHGMAIAAENEY
jgi:hypothetical protein